MDCDRDLLRQILTEPSQGRDDYEILTELVSTWHAFARPEQLRPDDCKSKLFIGGARGIGKNRSASELALDYAEDWGAQLSGFVAGRTAADTRDTIVNGVSGMRACARRRGYSLDWRPGSNLLVHPTGAQWIVSSGETVDAARGKNLNFAWLDELSWWSKPADALSNVELAFRADAPPPGRLMLLTATPNRKAPISFSMANDPDVTRAAVAVTKDNILNLSPEFVDELQRKYGGTSLGAQELEGRLIAEDGVVVAQDTIHKFRLTGEPPAIDELRRVIVAWDPGGSRSDADEHGVIVIGQDWDGHYYVLRDASVRGLETRAVAGMIVQLALEFEARTICYESNLGGSAHESLLLTAIESADANWLEVAGIHARQSKLDRAESAALLYETGKVHHCGIFPELESQLTQWVPPGQSPDRLDALVHGIRWLEEDRGGADLFAGGARRQNPLAAVSAIESLRFMADARKLASDALAEAERRLHQATRDHKG